MAYRCDICDKKTMAGRHNRHHPGVAGKRWMHRAQRTYRDFKPNLHNVTLQLNGVMTKVKACTSCIKRAKFELKKAQEATASTIAAA